MKIHQEVFKKRKRGVKKRLTNKEQEIVRMTKETNEINLAISEAHNKYRKRITCHGGSQTK